MSTEPIPVAAIQFEPRLFHKEENIRRLLDLAEQAARQGARLVVMPEMGTTGYCWQDREEVAPYVEPVPGATTGLFAELARRYDCYLVIGLPEEDPVNGLYYNTAVLIGPEGVIGKHRKTHPYISEPKWAANGDLGHSVFSTPIGNIALLICMDIHFIETARLAGIHGADVICHISNWLAERTPAPYWINRAYENNCYLIESNRWGLERGVQFSGGSCIIEPDGHIQAWRDGGDGLVSGTIRRASRPGALIRQRRPALYKELMNNSYAWNPLDFFRLYGMRPLPAGKCSRIAVGQFAPGDDVAGNLAVITRLADRASRQGAELLVLPELALSGEYRGPQSALTLDGEAVLALMRLAVSHRLTLVAGLVEASQGGAFYNTALAVGPQGVIGSYRKIHLTAKDAAWAAAGNEWVAIDLPCGRVGLLLGHDLNFPEAGRILALRGCDIIACPAALNAPAAGAHTGTRIPHNYPIATGASPYHWLLPRVRAGENNVYLAFANAQDSSESLPVLPSGIFGPDTFLWPRRESLVVGAGDVVTEDVDTRNLDSTYPTNVVRRKDLVAMRQTHFYPDLIRCQPGETA